jgi:hypothetical protein
MRAARETLWTSFARDSSSIVDVVVEEGFGFWDVGVAIFDGLRACWV